MRHPRRRLVTHVWLGLVLATTGHLLIAAYAQQVIGQPASIHAGTCAVPVPEPSFELGDLKRLGEANDDDEVGDAFRLDLGAGSEIGALKEDIDASLDHLLAAPHALIVHSAADYGEYLACGEIAGTGGDDDLVVPLRQLNDSGYLGVAVLAPDAGAPLIDDDEVDVEVYLFHGSSAPVGQATPRATPATPAASPAASPPADQPTEEVTVEMVDIDFNPNEFTIPADTDVAVHLPNHGAILHNFSVTEHNNPDVPNLGIDVDVQPGQSQTITVNAPAGDYYFFCDVPGHEAAGMFGTMHVR